MKKFVLAVALLSATSVAAFAGDTPEIACTPGNLAAIEKVISDHTDPAKPEEFGTAKGAIAAAVAAHKAGNAKECATQLALAAESVKTALLKK